MDAQISVLEQLVDEGVLNNSGVDGFSARSGDFEDVIARVEKFALSCGQDENSKAIVFPPGMTMQDFETGGYIKSRPQLAGAANAFCGNDHDHMGLLQCSATGDDGSEHQKPTQIALFRRHGPGTSNWQEGVRAALWS